MRRVFSIACVLVITSGCATTPHFDKISGVTPKTIVDVIECEIIAARQKNDTRVTREWGRLFGGKSGRKQPIRNLRNYYAVAELNLQVDEQLVLAPSFTHTDVVSKQLTRVFDWGVKVDSQAQRVYSESVAFDIAKLPNDKESCRKRLAGISLNGTLGLEEVVDMAFGSIDPEDEGIDFPATSGGNGDGGGKGKGKGKGGGKGGGKKGGASKGGNRGAFGTSLEFTLVGAITPTGPSWNLVNFKGPGKLFSAQRVDTHKVTISFATTPSEAALQNFIMTNSTLPTLISRKLQLQ